MQTYYAQTMPGIEDIAWLEIKQRLPRAKFVDKLFAKEQNGLVLFTYDGAPEDVLSLRTAEDVFIVAHDEPALSKGWNDLYELTKRIARSRPFTEAVDALMAFHRSQPQGTETTYRVISRLHGRFEYRRKDVARSVEKGIKAKYPHWKLVPDNARIEVWTNALGSRLIIGLRLSDRTMRHRFKREKEEHASLRPSVAAAMVHLSDPQPDDVFLDPLCGSGTILMERRLTNDFAQLLGGDIDRGRAGTAYVNLRRQRRETRDEIRIVQLDARRLPFASATINKVVSNLPFGKQIGSKSGIQRLYPAIFSEFERALAPEGRAIVLSSEYDLVKTAVRTTPALNILTGYSIAVLGQWGRIYIIEKSR